MKSIKILGILLICAGIFSMVLTRDATIVIFTLTIGIQMILYKDKSYIKRKF